MSTITTSKKIETLENIIEISHLDRNIEQKIDNIIKGLPANEVVHEF